MSDTMNAPTGTTTGAGMGQNSSAPTWLRVLLINSPYILIYAATIWLVALTDSDPDKASKYWQYLLPVVGLVSVIGGWSQTRISRARYLTQQVLHWGALMLVTFLLFVPTMEHFLDAQTHGFVVAYMLALAAILSGIYLDWKMGIFGLFLVGSAVGIGFLNNNAMLLTLIGIGMAGVAVTLVVRRGARD
ncbi:hypothetical protein F2Q65_03230 [Thiohalocapsa marina]|uniref:Uncharacterized protein n=1 Tax=Thiohalocapsa marina TaxID=424902 RepID=A0A5M8FRM4_9GAMM|nr:hypothetical protein [Thiohalocapsa marina]KAA6186916.1 hypothetical protein F2Q65_03230 [Thiohalocapsa marina]